MSRDKSTLTQAEQTEYRKRVERLRAAGADLDASSFESSALDWIQITHYRGGVHAFSTGSLFLIPVRIVALAPRVVIQDFELSSPAMELAAWFLGDPTLRRSHNRSYRCRDGRDFDRDEVLNHRTEAEGRLRHGDVMEGLFLAESFDEIPGSFENNGSFPICLSVINSLGNVHESKIALRVNRIAGRIQAQPPRRKSLFEREDGSPGSPEWVVDAPDAVSLHNGQPKAIRNRADAQPFEKGLAPG